MNENITPLPWTAYKGELIYATIEDSEPCVAVTKHDPKAFYALSLDAEECAANAAYIVEACNAYPALTARVEWLERKSCSVCSGEPLPSGKPCICGGAGSSSAEAQGLREALYDATARVKELEEAQAARKPRTMRYDGEYQAWDFGLETRYSGLHCPECGNEMIYSCETAGGGSWDNPPDIVCGFVCMTDDCDFSISDETVDELIAARGSK